MTELPTAGICREVLSVLQLITKTKNYKQGWLPPILDFVGFKLPTKQILVKIVGKECFTVIIQSFRGFFDLIEPVNRRFRSSTSRLFKCLIFFSSIVRRMLVFVSSAVCLSEVHVFSWLPTSILKWFDYLYVIKVAHRYSNNSTTVQQEISNTVLTIPNHILLLSVPFARRC